MEASVEHSSIWDQPAVQILRITWEKAAYAALLVALVLTRFWDLGARVMSHDESLHTQYSWYFFTGAGFQHSPLMHGPSLFLATAFNYFLFGDSDYTSRIFPAVMGIVLALVIPYLLRPWLGKVGALATGFMFLISPAVMYHSRYIRHDVPLITFAMVCFVALMYYMTRPKDKHLYWLAAGMALMFTTMEAAYIYTAFFLLMIGLKLVSDVLRVEWPNTDYKGYFRLGIAAGTVLGAVLLLLILGPEAFMGWPHAPRAVLILLVALAGAGFIAALVFLILAFGRRLNQLPSFNLLVLVGTLVLPMLAAFVIKLVCEVWPTSNFCIQNMDDVNWEQWRRQAEVLLIPGGLYVISIAVGLLWDWKRWLIAAAVFYAIFIPLYTSFFTWGPGFVTGVIGGLGYWLAQQGVERGSQPWYYYLWLWPFYEFLVVIFGMIVGFIYVAAKRRGLALYEKLTLLPALAIVITLAASGPQALAKPQYLMALLALLGFLAVPLAGVIRPLIVARRASAAEAHVGELELEDLPEPDDRAWLAEPERITRHAIPAMFLTFTGLWMWASVVGYSVAGEKMPWLITHLTAPAVLFAGWAVGRLLTSLDWREVWRRGGWAVFILGPVLAIAFYRMLEMAAFGQRPSLSTENAALINTGTWVAALIVALGALAGLFVWAQRVETREVLRILGVLAFALLAGLTIRASYRFCFITYDQAREFMVYAHGAPGTKVVMNQITDMSLRLNGDLSLRIAYDDDVSWPFTWYLRNFTNQAYYGASPSREQLEAPVVLVGDKNYSKVDPYMQQNYDGITYTFLWWPMQEYFYLTPERVANAFTQNPQTGEFDMLHGLWDIWMYRDYKRFADAAAWRTGQPAVDYSLGQWPVRHSMKMYVRRDVAAQLWDRGAAAVVPQPVIEDQCKDTQQSLAATLTVEGGLNYPRGIAVSPGGEIAVADAGNHRVLVFDATGQMIRAIGAGQCRVREPDQPGCADPSGRGQFNDPWGVAYDAQGNLYVADTWNHRVQKFDTQGNFLLQWGRDGLSSGPPNAGEQPMFWGPRAVAVGPDGRVYVVDTGNKRVQIFDTNGVYQGEFGTGGMTDGAFDEPVGIAFGPDGLAYVADTWNLRVQVFDPQTLAFVRKWMVTAWYGQSTENKPYIAVDGQGRVYVTAPEQYRVMAYDAQGTPALCWGQQGTDASSFGEPLGIATDKDGNIYVVDTTLNRVLKFAAP